VGGAAALTATGMLDAADLQAFADGTALRPFEFLGAHRVTADGVDGIRFAVWAPNASHAAVVGDFNDWDPHRHGMRKHLPSGVWEGFVAGVADGAHYKYALLDARGEPLPWKADPFAFAAELRPGTASRVAPLPPRATLPAERGPANARKAPISIYEVHAASWRGRPPTGFPDWDTLAATLPAYAADLGFTHVELLPIMEHPFDGSWGYQVLGHFAPSARFGEPAGLRRFVDACHARGLGVLLDWVPAHFPADEHGLARFDGTPLFEYADPREGLHRDWNTLIPDFAAPPVRSFLAGSALYWLERFGVDGLRVDAVASMLYRDYSRPDGEWVANAQGGRENLEAISLLREINIAIGRDCPGAVTIAEESTAFPGVSAPVHAGGLGFHYKWNMGWMNDTLAYLREDPVHRRWHHARMTFGLVYAFSENFVLPLSHDEVVHGKGSLLGRCPGEEWQRFATLRAYYGFQWGHPGKKLLFMGQEFAQPGEWDHDAALPWHLLDEPAHAGVARLVRDLNALYRARPALHVLDAEPAGFAWLVSEDAEQSVFAWLRLDGAGDAVVVASNFTPVPRRVYRVGVPTAGRWRVVLDTDAAEYGGSGHTANARLEFATDPIPLHGHAQSLALDLSPLATLFLVPA
jgi:1,4-alpha-glucan branching enzyme